MSSGADLFVVCKQCGAEVSPYITECPYCGNRLRRRAPKLPRARGKGDAPGKGRALRAWRSSPAGRRAKGLSLARVARRSEVSPYATIALVAASCGVWIAVDGGYVDVGKLMVVGPIHGEWWKLATNEFVYGNTFSASVYAFCAIGCIAIFGGALERMHGFGLVVALFLGAGASGALAAEALYAVPIVSGANGAVLALIAAWAFPDMRLARSGGWYEGDLLGAGACAAVLLAMPFARPEASWVAGIVGLAAGLLVGAGLAMGQEAPEL
jgi:hypothetical protein